MTTTFFRLLRADGKKAALSFAVQVNNAGESAGDVCHISSTSFEQVPGSPFEHWVSDDIRGLFSELLPFECLWPERVIPKCATDRSLAIAHGLEDVFWVEGTDGKWKPRSTPTRPVEELVLERSSSAVKSALKSLLEAPLPSGGTKRARKGKTHA